MHRLTPIVAIALLAVGCASFRMPTPNFDARLAMCLEDHAEWGQEICERVARAEVWLGMTEEQLLATWGQPSKIRRVTGGGPDREQWIYGMAEKEALISTTRVLFLQPTKDGTLIVVAIRR